MKGIILIVAAAICVLALVLYAQSTGPQALEARVGFASAGNIVARLPETAQVRAQLDTLKGQYDQELQDKVSELQQKMDVYKQREQMMNELIKKNKLDEINAQRNSIEQFRQQASQALAQKEQELMAPLFNKVQVAIDKVATERNYTHVLNLDAGNPLLLYAKPEFQVDSLVVTSMGLPYTPAGAEGQK